MSYLSVFLKVCYGRCLALWAERTPASSASAAQHWELRVVEGRPVLVLLLLSPLLLLVLLPMALPLLPLPLLPLGLPTQDALIKRLASTCTFRRTSHNLRVLILR